MLAVPGADGKIRSVIQHQGEAATYAFAGSAPGVMAQLFADPARPLLDQAVPRSLEPLPIADVAAYVERRFRQTGRDIGAALTPLLEFTRGHPMRSMMLAHYLWRRTGRAQCADEATWLRPSIRPRTTARHSCTRSGARCPPTSAASRAPSPRHHGPVQRGDRRRGRHQAREHRQGSREPREQSGRHQAEGRPRLTDPMFEHWLRARGLTPPGGEEDSDR